MPFENDSMQIGLPGITFWVTPMLRILQRQVREGDAGVFINGRVPVLQQAWQPSDDGALQWRDVPVVIDEP